MSLKKIEQVKADKGFKIWDLIIYGAIIVIVAVLFIVMLTMRDNSPLKGIQIKYVNDVVYEYDFEKGQISCNENFVEIKQDNEEKIVLGINFADGGYNVVEINKKGSVMVTEANCGKHDCVYTPAVKDNSGMIYCSPHSLKILPYNFDIDDGDIIV